MEISPAKTTSKRINAQTSVRSAFRTILHRARRCRRSVMAALLTGIMASAIVAAAQEERPQIIPGERKAAKRKDTGPRALGVLQMAANGKSTLVPVTILINGKFWDASAYKADPVPMALESGTVYEAERTGNSLGLFTVGSALHSNAANVQTPWIGTGSWHPVGSEQPAKSPKADTIPIGIETEDAPPRLTHDTNSAKKSPANGTPAGGGSPSTNAPSSNPPSSNPPSSSGPPDSDEPPRLTKGTPPPSSPQPSAPAGQSTPGSAQNPSTSQNPAGDSKPKDTKGNDQAKGTEQPKDTKGTAQPKVATSDSGADEANRPVLRRGRPAVSFADEDVPGYSKPGAIPPAISKADKPLQPAAQQGDVQLIPAISDAHGPDPRSFTFEWIKGEEEDRRKQMMELAKEQLRNYVAAREKAKIGTVPVHSGPTHRATKPAEPILDDVKMAAYDLWNSNQPVMIFSATAHMPPPPAGAPHSGVNSDLQYSIVLVAYPDIYNNLRKLYSGVTDKFHLDVTPRLDLIDAVDVDGDGRGELLFRETSDAGTGWVIYRASADKLWKMFDSLSPEG